MSAVNTASSTRSAARLAATIGLWILQVLVALVLLPAAFAKFTGSPEALYIFHEMGTGVWFAYLIGVLEVAAAVGMFVPRVTGLAALCLVLMFIGAMIVQAVFVGVGLIMPAVVLIASALIAWGRRDSTVLLWRSLGGSRA
jgi:putative oxidoreductase